MYFIWHLYLFSNANRIEGAARGYSSLSHVFYYFTTVKHLIHPFMLSLRNGSLIIFGWAELCGSGDHLILFNQWTANVRIYTRLLRRSEFLNFNHVLLNRYVTLFNDPKMSLFIYKLKLTLKSLPKRLSLGLIIKRIRLISRYLRLFYLFIQFSVIG